MHLADNPQPMHLGEEFLVAPGHILNPCQCRVGHASICVCARTCGGYSAYASYHGVGNARRGARSNDFRPTTVVRARSMRAGLNRILSLSSSNPMVSSTSLETMHEHHPGGPPCCCLPIQYCTTRSASSSNFIAAGAGPDFAVHDFPKSAYVSSSANL